MSKPQILIPIFLSLILAPLVLPAHATTPSYVAGVSAGDSTTYQVVKALYKTNNPTVFPEPQAVTDFNATVTATETVTAVSSDKRNVTGSEYRILNNSTGHLSDTFFVDLKTGDGNGTSMIIAGGLTAGDKVYDNSSGFTPTINYTKPLPYLGATRQVNIYNFTISVIAGPYYSIGKVQFFWDQASGVLLQLLIYENISYVGPSGAVSVYQNLDLVAIATNIWVPQPDFQISANPLTTTFAADSTGSSTVTFQAVNGFYGTIAVASSVNATGLTATCTAPGIVYPGYPSYSDCTFSSSTTGIYNVTITGTSGTLTHSVSIIVTVTARPDFSVTTDKTSITVLAGATGTIAVTVTAQNGFTGTVTLSDSITPSTGLTCTLSSKSVTLTSATTTGTTNLTCSGVYWGYTVTITGSSGTLTNNSPSVSVTVQDFTVAQSATTITTNNGTTGTATITVTPQDGFSGTVTLTQTVDKSGLTCNLSATTLTTGSSTLSCSGSPGTYTVTVTSKSQGLTHTTQYTVTVNGAQQNPGAPAATILGLNPAIFYSIIAGIIVAVAASVSVLALRSRKKPTA